MTYQQTINLANYLLSQYNKTQYRAGYVTRQWGGPYCIYMKKNNALVFAASTPNKFIKQLIDYILTQPTCHS